jgi:hypothetical protein
MELLIPGLIIVAIMVWASTRIKRNAAAAFEEESVETEEFSIRKPDGFLHVLNDDSGLAFRSYSKEFGKVGDREVRKATIEIEKHPATNIEALKAAFEERSEMTESFENYLDAGERAAWLTSIGVVNGGEYWIRRKLVTRAPDVWEARASVLTDHREGLEETLETTLESFQLK